jgi:methyl-accepting chemotaxis protein
MSKLSIRAKVIAVIAFMLVAMSGMGLLAIRSMQMINAHTVEIASSWLPSVRVLGELRTDINLFRIALRAHVMAETLEAKAANDKRLAGILDRIAKDRKAYEPLITTPEERSIYENWSRAWDKYITGVQEVIELSRQSVGRIPHEASEAISKKVAVIAAESDAFLEKSINLNNSGATRLRARPRKAIISRSGSCSALSLPSSSAASAWDFISFATCRAELLPS